MLTCRGVRHQKATKSYVRSFNNLASVKNPHIKSWVEKQAALCQPEKIMVCDGSAEEVRTLQNILVRSEVFIPLNPKLRPNSFLVRTDPADVARSEQATFISSKTKEDAGHTNNWIAPDKMKGDLKKLFSGCMKGRTMYVIPFSMGPIGSPLSITGVEITDSPYVAASMQIMTRVGKKVLDNFGNSSSNFIPCMHSVGYPLEFDESTGTRQFDVKWPCNIKNRVITHFPESREIWSYGSGYGGNSLLGKKALALRIASVIARDEGDWLAEHMLILGLTNPAGKKIYVAAAFPSACVI
jgi:phosphoenolpyruvate carboxykinase (GTP)